MAQPNHQEEDKNKLNALTILNEELENFFQSTIIPQLFFDRDLILRKYSPAALKQFNLKETDLGKYLHELSSNLQYKNLDADINIILTNNQIIEKEIQTNDQRWYRMNLLPFKDKITKKSNGAIITFVDVTNYILSLKELHKIISEHELFIFSVSHDLKGPLSNINGLIDVLNELIQQKDLKGINDILGMLKSSTGKLEEILTDLTQLSIEQYKTLNDKTTINFNDIFDEVVLTLKDKIDASGSIIIKNFQQNEISFIKKDLRSIFYNLLNNSIKYRSEQRKPIIIVTTNRENGFITISIKDNGKGIEEDKKEIIFSKFTRVSDNIEGTGVGLYLVSKIVDTQGGKIVVNSKINEGSEFIIYLKI